MAPCIAPLETSPSDCVEGPSEPEENHSSHHETPSKLEEEVDDDQDDVLATTKLPQMVQVLVELVGACNLSMRKAEETMLSSDGELRPYCVVKFGDRNVHVTRKSEGCQPIWTLDSQSLFCLDATADELATQKMVISVYSKHQETTLPFPLAGAAFLGRVALDGAKILSHCTEERLEFDLQGKESDEMDNRRGTLALRFRIATESDAKFVKAWNKRMKPDDSSGFSEVVARKQRKDEAKLQSRDCLLQEQDTNGELSPASERRPLAKLITEADETQLLGDTFMTSMSSAFLTASTVLDRRQDGKVRIKPNCDETRPDATTYMTPQEIKLETLKPSTKWTEAGSGNVGRLYLEILSCDDLPNVDVGEAVGNLTDSFVAAVYEDAVVQTPVIDDELSPCWMPWTERAFIFNMMHPASTLYLGCFDYDIGPLSTHDPIGRAAINISNLQRDTVYTLKYNLYQSASVTDRTPQGTITLRLRIEMNDEKAAILSAMHPRPKMHVNVHKEKSFGVVQYTCYGVHNDETQFELTVLRSYVNEILEYKRRATYSISDALTSLVFWRGQVKVGSVKLPIDSLLFFWATSTLVEKPHLLPAFVLLSVPWILMANMRLRTQHPSPWTRCPSFWHYLWVLKTGQPMTTGSRNIDAWEGWEEAKAEEAAWAKRLDADQKTAEKKAAMQQTLNEIGDDTIKTTAAGSIIPIDLLDKLGRYQGIIGGICRKLRFVRIILLWEESIVSFWITAVFLVAGIIALFLPWAFILTWLGRMVVWCFLGPHMMLIDFILTSRAKQGEESLIKFHKQKTMARIRREEALKLKAVKSLRFGKYITLVPNFNLARHYDRPLPQSIARPYDNESMASPDPKEACWFPGQQLYGAMIPRPKIQCIRNHELSMDAKSCLSLLEARLVALKVAALCGGGIQDLKERFRHLKGSQDEDEPDAIGYELIACGDTETYTSLRCSDSELEIPQVDIPDLSSLAYDGMSLRRVSEQMSSIFPTVYELEVEGPPKAASLEAEEVDSLENISENDSRQDSQTDLSQDPSESFVEDEAEREGIEIVAYEGDDVAADAVVCTATDVDGGSPVTSEVVFVAFHPEDSQHPTVANDCEVAKRDPVDKEDLDSNADSPHPTVANDDKVAKRDQDDKEDAESKQEVDDAVAHLCH